MKTLAFIVTLAGLALCGCSGSSSSSSSSSGSGASSGSSSNGGSTAGSNGGSTNGGSTNGGSTNGGSTNGGSTNGGSTTGSNGGAGWAKIDPPTNQDDAFIMGVYCTAADKCVVATKEGVSSDKGGVYALTASGAGAKLVDGTYHSDSTTDLPALAHQLGDIDFVGFTHTKDGLVARADNNNLYVVNAGDITSPSAWSAVNAGTDAADGSGLGSSELADVQGDASNNYVLIGNFGYVYTATGTPSAHTSWTPVWAPTAVPSVPANFDTLYQADPTLCNADITAGGLPVPGHFLYIASDLSVIVAPSGGLNQHYTDERSADPRPGVCISTDKGQHFYYSAFTNLPFDPADASSPGPLGVVCTDNDHCYAFSGEPFQTGTGYIYYSSNASQGKASTWTLGTMPATFAASQDITMGDVFFAPDGTHGWAVGNNNHRPLLLRTTDSGHTWNDVSSSIASLGGLDLYSGFALDADHIWIVGRNGFIASTSTAQQ